MKSGFLLIALISFHLMMGPVKAKADQDAPGVILFPSASLTQQAGNLAGNQNILNIDLRVGYRLSAGWYFGMIYNNTSSGGTNTLNGSSIGNSVGYFDGIFSVIASYYLSAQMSENTPLAYVQRSNGSGFQLDLSFNFPLSSNLYMGPTLTLKDMTYSAETFSGGPQINASQTQSFVYPFVGIYYLF